MATQSELLFEKFCSSNGFQLEPIQESTSRTPDYKLHLPLGDIVVEVKQFDPNKEETAAFKAFKIKKSGGCRGVPGKRVRQAITSGGSQIRNNAKGSFPSLLILYNNVLMINHTTPYFIKVGMYGFETYDLAIPDSNQHPNVLLDNRFGSNQKMTPTHNTSISAVGVIECHGDSTTLNIYHNIYSAIPLNPTWLKGPAIHHFSISPKRPKELPDWIEIQP